MVLRVGLSHFAALAVPATALNVMNLAKSKHKLGDNAGSSAVASLGEWIAQDPWMQLLNIAFFLLACYTVAVSRRNPEKASMSLGMNSRFQAILFVVYCFNSVAHMFLQAKSGSTHYSPVSATVLIYFGKSAVAAAMHIRSFGFDFSALAQPSGGRFGRVPAFVCTAIPGAAFAVYDMLSFVSLTNVDPVTYQIVIQCRIFLTALVWQGAFGRRCSGIQWLAMLMLAVATITKSVDALQDTDNAKVANQFGLFVLLFQVTLSSANSVCSEVLLKELPIPTDLLNCTMYSQGLLFLLFTLVLRDGPTSVFTELLSSQAWSRLFGDPWMVASVANLVAHGIFTAYFLREMSVVLKEMSGAIVTASSGILEWVILKSAPCTVVGIESVAVAALALLVYNTDPVATRKDVKDDDCEHSATGAAKAILAAVSAKASKGGEAVIATTATTLEVASL